MTVALSSTGSSQRVRSKQSDTATGYPKVTPLAPRQKATAAATHNQSVKVLPTPNAFPMWVRSLVNLQQGSSVVTLLLVSACLSVYGWTVYSQQMWHQQSRKLDTLRREEQQLAGVNEVLKNQIAKQAELPATGLVTPNPANMIFLESAPLRYQRAIPPFPPPDLHQKTEANPTPLGY